MLSAVPPQHGGAGEALPAGAANVGFLPGVGADVALQIARADETLPCTQPPKSDLEIMNRDTFNRRVPFSYHRWHSCEASPPCAELCASEVFGAC